MQRVDGTARGASSDAKRAAQGPWMWKKVQNSWARFSPRALLVKGAAWVIIRGKECYFPRVRVDRFGETASRVPDLDICRGAAWTERGWMFLWENTLHETTGLSSLLRGTRWRNHPTSHPPIKSTGLEIKLTKQTLFRWNISSGCLIFGGDDYL